MRNAQGNPGGATHLAMLEHWALRQPESVAILGIDRQKLSYGALHEQVAGSISMLRRQGIGRRDRVAIVLPNGPQMAVASLSVCACAVAAPLNPAYREEEFQFYLSDLRAKALLVDPGCAPAASIVASRLGIAVLNIPLDAAFENSLDDLPTSNDLALILHTSGTTSRPKIVPLTQANLMASAKNVAESLALTPDDRCLNVMPLFHIHGLVAALLASLWSGGSVVATPGFHAPRFAEWVTEYQPTWYTAVPTMHHSILAQMEKNPRQFGQLRFIRSCSAPLAPQLMSALEETFQAPVIEAYGMTEAAHQMTSSPLPPRERKPGSVGVAAGPEVAVMDADGNFVSSGQTGEVVIRGPNITAGYENNPAANSSSFTRGWFRTGDQGVLDQDGYLRLTGRLKEIINRGGEKIQPREIDEVLLDHPAVAQAVTFAIPDQRLGEDVGAAIVLRAGRTANAEEIRQFAASRLTDFKVPSRVVFLDEIPKGPTGKVQRVGLADKLGLHDAGQNREAVPYEPPVSGLEKQLATIWAEVLRTDRIGRADDFLQLGGDSMLASLVASRVQDRLGVKMTTATVLIESTVEKLAARIEGALRTS
jgi:acyl-CoA synthetase (AMP-forming)/AMP-acid ligase II